MGQAPRICTIVMLDMLENMWHVPHSFQHHPHPTHIAPRPPGFTSMLNSDDKQALASILALAESGLSGSHSANFSASDLVSLRTIAELAAAGIAGRADPDELATLRSMTEVLSRSTADFSRKATPWETLE